MSKLSNFLDWYFDDVRFYKIIALQLALALLYQALDFRNQVESFKEVFTFNECNHGTFSFMHNFSNNTSEVLNVSVTNISIPIGGSKWQP